jgi:phosphatidylserine decarboxylase
MQGAARNSECGDDKNSRAQHVSDFFCVSIIPNARPSMPYNT